MHAIGCLARFGVRAAAMLNAETARVCSGGAGGMLAPGKCATSMLLAETTQVQRYMSKIRNGLSQYTSILGLGLGPRTPSILVLSRYAGL